MSLALPAAAIESVYVIPGAAHSRGAGGTEWMTDLVLQNPGEAAITVDIALVRSGVPAEGVRGFESLAAATVAPGETLLLEDLLGDTLADEATGALILSGTAPFTATSRTYLERPDGTRGAAIHVARVFVDESSPRAALPGARVDGRYRTNVGIFAMADGEGPLEIEVSVGDVVARRLVTPAGEVSHVQFPIAPFGGNATATVEVRITAGRGVATAYASVVDNGSGDASVIEPFALESTPGSNDARLTVEERIRTMLGQGDPGGER
ncbi:MAG: hypothetical protein NDJ92_11045 [Thermoanaerobaculia bacterium]|nr:hypothetical protein [Thermoanaerobaculia bacterium]